ncbi:MAG: RNA 2',3'-cyclic phosphodiesterase [Pseudomonadota bacterium]
MRLFVALTFPDEVLARLAGLQWPLPGAKWVPEENLHLTVRFLGQVMEPDLAPICDALEGVAAASGPFDLTLSGTDVFGGAKPRSVWVGVRHSDALKTLHRKIDGALLREAGRAPDRRRFTPHVTLARFRKAPGERLGRFIVQTGLFSAGPIPIEEFTLFESITGGTHSHYRPLATFPLGSVNAG